MIWWRICKARTAAGQTVIGGVVQAGADPASVRNPIAAADHAGCGSERGVSLVSGIYDVAKSAALCDDQLHVLPLITAEVIESVFRWILEEVARAGYLSPEIVFVDGTHIKANAKPEEAHEEACPSCREAVSGATGRGD